MIEACFELKNRALDFIFSHIKISKKAHLKLSKEERKKLRDEILKEWKYSKHYVDSAINSVIGLVKGWISLYNKGKARQKPEITKKTIYIKNTLFSYKNGLLKISIEPNKRYFEVDLRSYSWIPKDFERIGGLLMTENELIVTLKKNVEPKAEKWASFDVNLTNITALIDGEVKRYDLKELYHIHRVYELKRQKIQKLSKKKPKTAEKLMEKYSNREKNRAKDFMQKLTTKIAKELFEKKCGAIFEDLKSITDRVLDKSKELNRKLSKWNARTFQFMLGYKLLWNGLAVKYVDPKNSSKTCPLCSGGLASYEGWLMKCGCGFMADRDVVAVLNLQMWGSGVAPKGYKPAFAGDESQELHRFIKAYVT
ncbi:MAG: putative transposase [Archaeoglobaceae archaeon]|nr:putative transposase [Archaeoglobaceae archaeon]